MSPGSVMALWLDPPFAHSPAIPFRSRRRTHIPTRASPLSICSSSSALHLETATPAAAPSAIPRQKLVIAGGRQLSGHIRVGGSKNAALAVLAGALCCSAGASVVRGVPAGLSDVQAMLAILRSLGARVDVTAGGGEEEGLVVVVEAGGVAGPPPAEPCAEAVRRTRAGFFVVGPLVGRFGAAEVALPGGCEIGARPVDIYVDGLRALGAVVELRNRSTRRAGQIMEKEERNGEKKIKPQEQRDLRDSEAMCLPTSTVALSLFISYTI